MQGDQPNWWSCWPPASRRVDPPGRVGHLRGSGLCGFTNPSFHHRWFWRVVSVVHVLARLRRLLSRCGDLCHQCGNNVWLDKPLPYSYNLFCSDATFVQWRLPFISCVVIFSRRSP